MADPLIHQDKANIEQAKAMLDIQVLITENIKKQQNLFQDIGRINKDVAAQVNARGEDEKKMIDVISAKTVLYYQELQRGNNIQSETVTKAYLKNLANIKDSMKRAKEQLAISREISKLQISMEQKRHEEDTKWIKFSTSKFKEMTGLKTTEFDMTKNIGDQLIKNGIESEAIAYTFSAILVMVKSTYDLFNKLDLSAFAFRKVMGMTRIESQFIRKDAQDIAISYMAMGVTIDGVYKSYAAIGRVVGGVHNVTKDMARDVSLMSSQLGISEELSVGLLSNLAAVSNSTIESQTNMLGMAQSLSSAAGVPLADVMKDVSSRSQTTLTMMSRMPIVALRTSIELHRMGTSMEEASKSSRHILDFSENINEEMNASVLLGRSINLQRARELAYHRDIEGSTKEILRITKSIGFAQLDTFQQEAFATATGKSVDELMRMLQTDKQIALIRNGTDAKAKEELATYEKMRMENEATAKLRAEDSMTTIRTMLNQERISQITNHWNQLLAKAEQFLLPIVDLMLRGALAIIDWVPAIMAFSMPLGRVIKDLAVWILSGERIAKSFDSIGSFVMKFGKVFDGVAGIVLRIGTGVSKFVGGLGKAFGVFGKLLGFAGIFAKWVPVLGWIIMAFQFISSLITRISNAGFVKGDLGGNILKGLKAVGLAIYDVLIAPFANAFKWIWHLFGGHSPSLLGLGIVKGIVGIGSMLFNAIIAPWRMAFGWIANKFAGIGRFFGRIFGRHDSVEKKAQAAYVTAVKVTPNGTTIETPTAKSTSVKKKDDDSIIGMTEETGKKMLALLEKILTKDTSIRMDGQLLSSTLARQTEFKGGYGVNKV